MAESWPQRRCLWCCQGIDTEPMGTTMHDACLTRAARVSVYSLRLPEAPPLPPRDRVPRKPPQYKGYRWRERKAAAEAARG